MRNTSKGFDIREVFPIYAVENNFLINKAAEITAAYKLVLPEIFTVSKEDYESMHALWLRAIRVLPDYTIICKQDWYTKEKYHLEKSNNNSPSFLEESYRTHFKGRPYLKHVCYLFLTQSRKGRSKMQSIDSMLLRGNVIPQGVSSKMIETFSDTISQFEQILKDSGVIKIERISDNELVGTNSSEGVLSKYMNLSQDETRQPLQDIIIKDGNLRIGDNRIIFHTISSADDLPSTVGTDLRHETYSTENSDCLISFTAPLGLLLYKV